MALGDIHLRFAWQAWHLWHWAGSGGALGLGLVAGDAAALCVAGVALGDIHLRFAWQAWHLWHWAGSGGGVALGLALVAGDAAALCVAGVAQAWRHPPSFHVAGVALGDIYLRFAWQAWHLWHWAGSVAAWLVFRRPRFGTLRGRRGTWRHPPSFLTWQAWHLSTSHFA